MPRGGARTGAGRPSGIHTSWSKDSVDRLRGKIQTEAIIQRLARFIDGEIEMPAAAVTAALGLLRKIMPDTAQVEHTGEVTTNYVLRVPPQVDTVAEWQQQNSNKPVQTIQ